jgi:hypothetical protein
MSRLPFGTEDGAGTPGSMDPKKAIRLMRERWIARTPRRKASGSPRTCRKSSCASVPSRIELARRPQPAAGAQGPLEVRRWPMERAGLDRVRSAR